MHATQPARLAAQYYYIAGTLSVAELRLSEQATVAVFALNCPKTIRPVLLSKSEESESNYQFILVAVIRSSFVHSIIL